MEPKFFLEDDVIVLEGYFFLPKKTLKSNNPVVQQTIQELYRFVSNN
ncbi:MAG: hypothetical protein AB7F28_03315 [Candidatus Margulisiibacteriota bacterium]